jgi:hypothetical protein
MLSGSERGENDAAALGEIIADGDGVAEGQNVCHARVGEGDFVFECGGGGRVFFDGGDDSDAGMFQRGVIKAHDVAVTETDEGEVHKILVRLANQRWRN